MASRLCARRTSSEPTVPPRDPFEPGGLLLPEPRASARGSPSTTTISGAPFQADSMSVRRQELGGERHRLGRDERVDVAARGGGAAIAPLLVAAPTRAQEFALPPRGPPPRRRRPPPPPPPPPP